MADILDLPNCGGAAGTLNTGFALCDVIRKAPKALFLLDSGVVFSLSDRASIASMVSAMENATRAARGSRLYPIMQLTNFEDQSKEATKAAVGNLSISEITMQEGVPAFTFQHYKGDLFHRQLANAENSNVTLLILDAGNVLYGTKDGTDFTGFSLSEFKAQLAKFATATDPAKYPFSVVLDSIVEYKDNLGIIQLDSTVSNLSGIVDVDLNTAGAPPVQATNVIKISPIGRGGKNLGLLFPTELAATSAWKATKDSDGTTFTITSVSWDSSNSRFNVTLDSTAYTALSTGATISVTLVSTAALAALGVDGFESLGPVTVTK